MTQRFARVWAFAATTLAPALAFANTDKNCYVPKGGHSSVPELDPSSAVAAFTLLAAAALYMHRKSQTRA